MHLYTIPYQDKFIIYRPLRRLAFVGNRSMADLCVRMRQNPEMKTAEADRPAFSFLKSIGFLEPDPPFPEDKAEKDFFLPTVCVLFPTTACNLRCVYCYAYGGDRTAEDMPVDLARTAVDRVCRNAIQLGLDYYSLCFHGGGEPTRAWKLLQECIAYARHTPLSVRINLTSNGAWSDRKRNWILEHIDDISLSFDGPADIQNRQRPLRTGSASFPTVMETVRALNRTRKPFGIRVTIIDDTIERLPDIVAFLCRETEAHAFQVEPAFNHGRARTDHQALRRNDRFAEAFLEGYDIARQQGRHMYYSGARPWLLTNRFCDAFDKALIVGPNGFLTACYEVCGRSHELADQFIFGTLDPKRGLSINSNRRRGFLDRIQDRKRSCRDCFCYFHCAGDCPSKTFSPEKDGHLRYGSRCELNRTITRELLIRNILEGDGVWQGDPADEYRLVEPVR